MSLEQLEAHEEAARVHLAAMESAETAAALAKREAFDAYNPRETSAKAVAPIEAARARLEGAKHHVAKARAAYSTARAATAAERARLARAAFDAAADKFGMRGWTLANAERERELADHLDAAERLCNALLADVDRFNVGEDEVLALALATGAQVPARASAGPIAMRLRRHRYTTPLAIDAAGRPGFDENTAWGVSLLPRLEQHVDARFAEPTEVEPEKYFALLERGVDGCGFDTQEREAVIGALRHRKSDFFDYEKKRTRIKATTDAHGRRVETRVIMVGGQQ